MDTSSILKITEAVVGFASPLLPAIIQLFQQAHPIPPDATPEVKADINAMKANGSLQAASVLVNQAAAAGKVPVAASDPTAQAALAGAIKQLYESMKASGELGEPAAKAQVQQWVVTITPPWPVS